jgi:hypothetical protein
MLSAVLYYCCVQGGFIFMSYKAAVFFTAKSVETLVTEGGTSAWRLDRNHARQCAFAVCTRNTRRLLGTPGPEAHCSAFLVAKIKDVVPAPDRPGRYLVQFSEYARVNILDAWKSDRNPVKYATLEELGIDPSTLKWERMPEEDKPHEPARQGRITSDAPLTMAEAKKGLALAFGVSPEAIEITIRG